MYISKKDREIVKNKFGGNCAYTGTLLKDDWQIDHVKPLIRKNGKSKKKYAKMHQLDNMFPVQKIVNHYKGSLDLELTSDDIKEFNNVFGIKDKEEINNSLSTM